jgi:hypothetical protein
MLDLVKGMGERRVECVDCCLKEMKVIAVLIIERHPRHSIFILESLTPDRACTGSFRDQQSCP